MWLLGDNLYHGAATVYEDSAAGILWLTGCSGLDETGSPSASASGSSFKLPFSHDTGFMDFNKDFPLLPQ